MRDADDNSWTNERATIVNFSNENAQHLLSHLEISDDAIFQGTDSGNRAWGSAQHIFGFCSNGDHSPTAFYGAVFNRHHRRLITHYTPALLVNQGVRRSQIDREIVREKSEKRVKYHSASRDITEARFSPFAPLVILQRRGGIINLAPLKFHEEMRFAQ